MNFCLQTKKEGNFLNMEIQTKNKPNKVTTVTSSKQFVEVGGEGMSPTLSPTRSTPAAEDL